MAESDRPVAAVVGRAEARRTIGALLADGGVPVVDDPAAATVVVSVGRLERPAHVDALERLLDADARVVAVVPEAEPAALKRAVDRGLLGCVVGARVPLALAATIRAVACGQVVLPHEYFDARPAPVFSTREKQVLGLVVLGYSNADIARKLFLAESTVKSHLSSSFAKLGVRSRSEAATVILDPDNRLGLGILAISPDS